MRKAAIAAAGLAVAVPVGVLAVSHGSSSPGGKCVVRYTPAAGQMRLTVTLMHAGSVAVVSGSNTARRDELAGTSTLPPLPDGGLPTATEFTTDGQLVVCRVSRG